MQTSSPGSSPTTSSLLPRAWLAGSLLVPCFRHAYCTRPVSPTAHGLSPPPSATRPTRTSCTPRTFCTPRIARRHSAHSRSRIIMASAERLDTPIKVCKDVDVSLCCLHGEPRHFGCCGPTHSTEVGSSRGDESLCSVRLGSARCRLVPARNGAAAARRFLGRALRVVCMDRVRLVVHGTLIAQITPRQ